MPQAFTDVQMDEIRQRLFQSACKYAVETGVRKTSMEMLTQDAGISKSTFYKFFESKEVLFLKVAQHFEQMVIKELKRMLKKTAGKTSKERTAAAVNAAFVLFAKLGAIRFFSEDLPQLAEFVPRDAARDYLNSMSEKLLDVLQEEQIQLAVPRQTAISVIGLLYRSIPAIAELDNFVDAFHVLVLGACNQLIA